MGGDKLGAIIMSTIAEIALVLAVVFLFMKPPATEGTMLTMIIGALVSGHATVLAYWLGSSSSSRKKDDVIGGMAISNGTGSGTNGTAAPTI